MVTCQQCINRQISRERYDLGNPARPQMGHEMHFTSDGRTALCAAAPRQSR